VWNSRGDEKVSALVDVAIHPVTGDIISRFFRVSAIAPVNIPLVFAMISCPASNLPGTLFLHWVNQSYNTACNYANRSGADQEWQETAKAYGLAVISACSIAFGLGKAVERGPPILRRFGVLIPCFATSFANVTNLGFTRIDEILKGTNAVDSEGNVRGVSKIAGTQGVVQTAMTRCILVPAACLLLPPFAMSLLKSVKLLPKSAHALMGIELAIIYMSLQAALPGALAVFPQTATFDVSRLEAEFQGIKDSKGRPIAQLFSNKGL
jgi:hypothetical protein